MPRRSARCSVPTAGARSLLKPRSASSACRSRRPTSARRPTAAVARPGTEVQVPRAGRRREPWDAGRGRCLRAQADLRHRCPADRRSPCLQDRLPDRAQGRRGRRLRACALRPERRRPRPSPPRPRSRPRRPAWRRARSAGRRTPRGSPGATLAERSSDVRRAAARGRSAVTGRTRAEQRPGKALIPRLHGSKSWRRSQEG
jgi:hypothetical protein